MTSPFEIEIKHLGPKIEHILQQVIATHLQRDTSGVQLTDPARLEEALHQYLTILDGLDAPSKTESDATIDAAQINLSELGDYGLNLLSELFDWNSILQLDATSEDLHHVILSLALWIARHDGKISSIEQLVNSISFLANRSQEPALLARLSKLIEEIIEAVNPASTEDGKGEPWRILNLNYGIVATRSHNPEIIEAAFEKLLLRIPAEAAAFFAEGMEQMDIVGYPDNVRRIMEKYYQQTQNRVLH